jgi:hypothetical protein
MRPSDNVFLKFQGFHPSDYARDYLTSLMEELHDEAPYGATLQANFSRHGHVFRGVVTIYSSAGKFFAQANDNKLKEATRKMVAQIRRQLGKWKSSRFQKPEASYDGDHVA